MEWCVLWVGWVFGDDGSGSVGDGVVHVGSGVLHVGCECDGVGCGDVVAGVDQLSVGFLFGVVCESDRGDVDAGTAGGVVV